MALELVARKTVTHIQDGSRYRDRFHAGTTFPNDATVRQIFKDSAGADIVEIDGTIDGKFIVFDVPYDEVATVPNGAGFYTYVHYTDTDDDQMARYGSTFRRELTFPNSPAAATSTVVRQFEDSFQRPAGAVGGRWKVLVGAPVIFDNTTWFGLGEDYVNTVGHNWTLFESYFCYYYQPFNSDTVEIAFSAAKKGGGITIVTLCQTSSASSYLYAGFNGSTNKVVLGYGTSPNIGPVLAPTAALQPQITPVDLTVPTLPDLGRYVLRYDDVTSELTLYNSDKTVEIAQWTDDDNLVPHGKGARYFGIGGNSGLLDSGVQLAEIRAQGVV